MSVESDLGEMLLRDNAKLRDAGFDLAQAAAYTVREYDGLHRLSLAAAGWFKAVADQGDRDTRAQPLEPKD